MQYVKYLQTEDVEDVEGNILDMRNMNKRPQKFHKYFALCNQYLDGITSVDTRRHGSTQKMMLHCSIASFMQDVKD